MPQPYDPALVDGLVSLAVDPALAPPAPATNEMIMASNGIGGESTETEANPDNPNPDVGDDPGDPDDGNTGGASVEPTRDPRGTPSPIATLPPPTKPPTLYPPETLAVE